MAVEEGKYVRWQEGQERLAGRRGGWKVVLGFERRDKWRRMVVVAVRDVIVESLVGDRWRGRRKFRNRKFKVGDDSAFATNGH